MAEEFNEYSISVFCVKDLGNIPKVDEGSGGGGLILRTVGEKA